MPDEATDRLIKEFPITFWKMVWENTEEAFATADATVQNILDKVGRARALSQLRHDLCEQAVRKAAKDSGLHTDTLKTTPPGGQYVFVITEGATLIRANIQHDLRLPDGQFRARWAFLNRWIPLRQLGLFDSPLPLPAEDMLCAMLVVVAPPPRGDQSAPIFIGVGIPQYDLSRWHSLISIDELIARYHDADAPTPSAPVPTPSASDVTFKDSAKPSLKPAKKKKEEDQK